MDMGNVLIFLFLMGVCVWWVPIILEAAYHIYFEKPGEKEAPRDLSPGGGGS